MDRLLNLQENEKIEVKVMAASYLLEVHEKEALQVLYEISNSNDDHWNAFNAEMILKEWEKGTLPF